MKSAYMEWAKVHSHAPINLASSGLSNVALRDLPVEIGDIELSGESWYGYEPLQQAIASLCHVHTDNVVATTGTSMANHLAMAAVLEPGDEVLIEHPTYELLISTAKYLGANIKRFNRKFSEGFQVNARAIEQNVTPRTRLIVLTNLHNPSSAFTSEETLREVGRVARAAGSYVLVDEVYLDAVFEPPAVSAVHLGPEFIATRSLTKVYGLSGLRCGWILANPELTERIWKLNDLFGVIPAHPAERLSCIALANLNKLAERARFRLEANGLLLNSFLESRQELAAIPHKHGTVSFPRCAGVDVERLCRLLMSKYETSVVPGRFFEMREHFRIGLGCDEQMFSAGLQRIGMALSDIAHRDSKTSFG